MVQNLISTLVCYQDSLIFDTNNGLLQENKINYTFKYLIAKNSILMLLPNNGRILGYPLLNNALNLGFFCLFKNYDLNLKGVSPFTPFKFSHNLIFDKFAINLDSIFESKSDNNSINFQPNNSIDSSSKNNFIVEESNHKVISSKTNNIIENTNIESTNNVNTSINNDLNLNSSSSSNDYSNNIESTNNVNHNTESTNNILLYLSKTDREIKGHADDIDNVELRRDVRFKILRNENIFVSLDIVNDSIVSILDKKLENPINFIFIENDADLEVFDSNNNILIQNLKIFKEKQNLKYKFLMKYIDKFDFITIMNLFNGVTKPDIDFELKKERNIIINRYLHMLRYYLQKTDSNIREICLKNVEFRNYIQIFMNQSSYQNFYMEKRLNDDTTFLNNKIDTPIIREAIIKSCDFHLQLNLMIKIVEDSFKKIYNE